MVKHRFTRGETVQVALENMDGAEVSSVGATLKQRGPDGQPTGSVVASFTVEARESVSAGLEGGWLFSLSPAVTTGLRVGGYCMDARLVVSGTVFITDILNIEIEAGATETAP